MNVRGCTIRKQTFRNLLALRLQSHSSFCCNLRQFCLCKAWVACVPDSNIYLSEKEKAASSRNQIYAETIFRVTRLTWRRLIAR